MTMSCPSIWAASEIGSMMSTSNAGTPLARSGTSADSSRSMTVMSNSGAAESNCTIACPILPAPTSVSLVGDGEVIRLTVHRHHERFGRLHVARFWSVMERTDDGPSLTRDLALATWGLFVGLACLLLAAGLFGTLLGVRSELVGLPTVVSSLISASYYAGFLLGSRGALAALGRVGHIRVYAALASMLSAAMLAVGLTDSAPAWAGLRFVTGLCLAGQYVVAESWLNNLATNENRGRLL